MSKRIGPDGKPLGLSGGGEKIDDKHKGKKGVIKFIGEIEGKNAGNWVGIERESEYCDIAHRRLDDERKQRRLL